MCVVCAGVHVSVCVVCDIVAKSTAPLHSCCRPVGAAVVAWAWGRGPAMGAVTPRPRSWTWTSPMRRVCARTASRSASARATASCKSVCVAAGVPPSVPNPSPPLPLLACMRPRDHSPYHPSSRPNTPQLPTPPLTDQVRRSTYHDVVKASDLAELLGVDLAGVQPYSINNARVSEHTGVDVGCSASLALAAEYYGISQCAAFAPPRQPVSVPSAGSCTTQDRVVG